jgi:hypothetical protein
MAKITYIDPIKSVSGKLTKSHCVVYNKRVAATNNQDMIDNPNYTTWRDPSKKIVLSANQRAWNERFAEICSTVRVRLQDPQHMAADRAGYATQSKYKTLYSYVWNLVKNEEA